MALHELTTNAAKHGALGQKNGRLHVRWRVETENGSPWILVDWKESGVETAKLAMTQGEPEMVGALSRTLCPISSEPEQLSRSNRTASIARSRFRSPDLKLEEI